MVLIERRKNLIKSKKADGKCRFLREKRERGMKSREREGEREYGRVCLKEEIEWIWSPISSGQTYVIPHFNHS